MSNKIKFDTTQNTKTQPTYEKRRALTQSVVMNGLRQVQDSGAKFSLSQSAVMAALKQIPNVQEDNSSKTKTPKSN